jgi:alkanesulfonate monooxygenase SsuD/methylene tetrahydromethanopterin reductase-like flavin-dependent oxidoreductase (luciferase family)
VSKLAREVTTLDRLTAGRMILGAPIADEFGSFGETTDPGNWPPAWTKAWRR